MRLQVHDIAREVLEVERAPADGADQPTMRAHRLSPEGSGWVELYVGPVVALEASARRVSCPEYRHCWAPQVEMPAKCPKCGLPGQGLLAATVPGGGAGPGRLTARPALGILASD